MNIVYGLLEYLQVKDKFGGAYGGYSKSAS